MLRTRAVFHIERVPGSFASTHINSCAYRTRTYCIYTFLTPVASGRFTSGRFETGHSRPERPHVADAHVEMVLIHGFISIVYHMVGCFTHAHAYMVMRNADCVHMDAHLPPH